MGLTAAGEVAEVMQHLHFHTVDFNTFAEVIRFEINFGIFELLAEQRIGVFTFYLEFQVEREMIDTGSPVEDIFHVSAEHVSQSLGGGGGVGA